MLHIVAAADAAERMDSLESSVEGLLRRTSSGGLGSSSSQHVPPGVSSTWFPEPQTQAVQQFRPTAGAPCCPNCSDRPLSCPVVDEGMYWAEHWAEIRWHFIPPTHNGLVDYFTYGDVRLMDINENKNSSMHGTFFLGADGHFSNSVVNILKTGLAHEKLELIFHLSNSRKDNIIACRCIHCNYCCSIIWNQHAAFAALVRMRGSLARWLGVEQPERSGSACYVTGAADLFSGIIRNQAMTPSGQGC